MYTYMLFPRFLKNYKNILDLLELLTKYYLLTKVRRIRWCFSDLDLVK